MGALLTALGVVALFAPGVLAGSLPGGMPTAAVGWTAVGVGPGSSTVGAWQLVGELRRRSAPRRPG